MAKQQTLTPARATKTRAAKLPPVEVTREMRDDVDTLKIQFEASLGRIVSIGDIVRWSVQAFIDSKKGR